MPMTATATAHVTSTVESEVARVHALIMERRFAEGVAAAKQSRCSRHALGEAPFHDERVDARDLGLYGRGDMGGCCGSHGHPVKRGWALLPNPILPQPRRPLPRRPA